MNIENKLGLSKCINTIICEFSPTSIDAHSIDVGILSNRTYSSYDFFQQMAQHPVNGVKKWDHMTEASKAKASAS